MKERKKSAVCETIETWGLHYITVDVKVGPSFLKQNKKKGQCLHEDLAEQFLKIKVSEWRQ